ncbi:MAG: T9SS type A sorting domain-containing protein, partial [Dysgonamonadaceae bacterium]|nr:T9SS type A sorting domain-containing protein [Dysgonamonadaceae bacterium]
THTPEQAYEQVLQYAGCSLVRDALDTRIIEEARTNTAAFTGAQSKLPGIIDSQQDLKPDGAGDNWSAWPDLTGGTPLSDTNSDGIPDGWLENHYPGKIATDRNEEGYAYLEVYLNSIVSEITEKQNQGGKILGWMPAEKSRNEISCYTNQFSKTLTIRAEKKIRQIDLFSVTGQKIYSVAVGNQSATLDLPGTTHGIYIVKAVCEDIAIPSITKIKM